jgi:protein pelota
MKIVSRHIERDGSGSVSLIPEEDEDMYHLYNLVEPHDRVRAPAVRRVQSESSTGSIESHRVRVTLTIEVAKTTFDATGSNAPLDPAQATDGISTPSVDSSAGALGGGGGGEGATLQVAGRVVSENKHVKMGAFHTLDLECNRQVTIIKDSWDSIHLERLSDSSDVGQRAEVGAVVLGEGESHPTIRRGLMLTVFYHRYSSGLPPHRAHDCCSTTDRSAHASKAQVIAQLFIHR